MRLPMYLVQRLKDRLLHKQLRYGAKRIPGVALVTGANKGIGLEVVRQLSEEGWTVILCARSREKGSQAAASLGKNVMFVPLDVTSQTSITTAVQEVSRLSGVVDLLVNNAAILLRDQDKSVCEVSVDVLRQCWETNCLGPLLITRAFLPLLRKSKAARVINVSTEISRLSMMRHLFPAYCISKTGLNAVTRQLAAACETDRIPVNAVCPGWVKTDMGGPDATISIEQGARAIVRLGTEVSAEITGTFIANGKMLRW